MNKDGFPRIQRPPSNKWYIFSTGRDTPMTSRFAIHNGLNPPLPVKTEVKLPKIIKSPIEYIKKSPVGKTFKKWFPNSTGRDTPMTSRFGIEHNKSCENLRPGPIFIPDERKVTVKILPVSPVESKLNAPQKRNKSLFRRGLWGLNMS